MRFSVCIPAYNAEKYLRECLDSAVHQTFHDYEIVIVNDGSTDSTPAIIDEYAKALGTRMKVVTQENAGLLMARRRGFEASLGEYVVPLDADDALRSDALSIIDAAISRSHADVVVFEESRSRDFSLRRTRSLHDSEMLYAAENYPMLFREFCLGGKANSLAHIASKAIRRGCLNIEHDYSEMGRQNILEDRIQMAEVYSRADAVLYINAPLYFYRLTSSSLTHKHFDSRLQEYTSGRQIVLEYVEGWEQKYRVSGLVDLTLDDYLWDTYFTLVGSSTACTANTMSSLFEQLRSIQLYRRAINRPNGLKKCRVDCRWFHGLVARGLDNPAYYYCRLAALARRAKNKKVIEYA